MFRIRRVFDDVVPFDRKAVAQVQAIMRLRFPGIREQEVSELPQRLRNPVRHAFRSFLFVADDPRGDVKGFALLSHDADLRFCYLDYIATRRQLAGGGVGGAIYERVREEARSLGSVGLFFECERDEREHCEGLEAYRANVARMRFYEGYTARPIVNTNYTDPISPEQRDGPYLMLDSLGRGPAPRRELVRKIVRSILERKYSHLCPPDYVRRVVDSFRDDPVQVRPPKYAKPAETAEPASPVPPPRVGHITLVVNDKHEIHHVRDRGYVEAPVRIRSILTDIEPTGLFLRTDVREYSDSHILAVHDDKLVNFLKKACLDLPEGKSVYPYVFPIRNATRPPKEVAVSAGYYCIDTFTPLNHRAYLAAKRAVDCTLTAADAMLKGERLAYALVRPPGHHAERHAFGGFCYFNNNAVTAHYLSRHGPVAILDIDYHHGNGQQMIFYERADVLTVSIHGHPRFAYPYFTGFADERGAGFGEGANLNIPLPEHVDGKAYRVALERALARIARFRPAFLVVALGLDTAKGDPTGTWTLGAKDFEENGKMIGALRLPTLVVQEGGYRTRTLGTNAKAFFVGLARSVFGPNGRESRRGFRPAPPREPEAHPVEQPAGEQACQP